MFKLVWVGKMKKTQAAVAKIVQEKIAEWIEDIEEKSSANNCNSIRCSDRLLSYFEKELIKLGFIIDDSEEMDEMDNYDKVIYFSVSRV